MCFDVSYRSDALTVKKPSEQYFSVIKTTQSRPTVTNHKTNGGAIAEMSRTKINILHVNIPTSDWMFTSSSWLINLQKQIS